jgi:formylglycine-generating enzyme required for sulfatase activity
MPLRLSLHVIAFACAGLPALAQEPGKTFRDCPTCPEMTVVPAGEFTMGSPESEIGRNPDEGPQRKVTIAKPFAVGKFEVTFAEWDACVAERGCTQKPSDFGWGRLRRPVIFVSYADAIEFTAWLTNKTGKPYRLLTEAEWEYAARGVTKATEPSTPFSTGQTIAFYQANYDPNWTYGPQGRPGTYKQKTETVGTYPRNKFGLHDMHGNVWEWVQDCYRPTYDGAPTDGSAVSTRDCETRVARGGSWNYYPQMLRSAYRYGSAPTVRTEFIGFRVARPL